VKSFRFRAVIGCLAVLLTVSGCGSSKPKDASSTPSVPAGKPLTLAQAEVLAGVLTKNYDAGGAVFSVTVPYSPQTTYSLSGSIDYTKDTGGPQGTKGTKGVGQATLRITSNSGKDTADSALLWTKNEVIEELPGLTEAVAAKGRPGVKFISRPLTTSSPQDVVLNLLLGTASEQRENPALIQQGTEQGDSAFLRTDTLRNTPVDVYRFGKRTTYWVGHDDGILMRLEATLAIAPGVTVIDFLEHKAVSIPGPTTAEVILASDIPDIMKTLTDNTIAPAAPPPVVVTTAK
jgi:hypothetical protein